MTVANVKAISSPGLVYNTFKDSAGVDHTIGDYFIVAAGTWYQTFYPYLQTTTPTRQVFTATDLRGFIATDQRKFIA